MNAGAGASPAFFAVAKSMREMSDRFFRLRFARALLMQTDVCHVARSSLQSMTWSFRREYIDTASA
jgi:hypothetical protein